MSNSSGFLWGSSRRQERARDSLGRLAERREKGLWSFLTWSFFLSQVVTMEQASAAEARAGATGDEAGPAGDPAAGQAARNAFLPVEPATLAEMQEAPQAATQNLAQPAMAPAAITHAPTEFAAPAGLDSTDESSAVRQTSAALASSGEIQTAANSAPAATLSSNGGSPDLDGPPILGPIIDPIVEVVGDVVDDVVQVLDPVLGIAGGVLGDVVHALDPVLEQVVAPVLGIAADMLSDVVHALDPVLEHVVAPVLGSAGDVLGDVVHVLDPVLEHVAAPVADVLSGSLASLLGFSSDGGSPIIVASVVASSGSIDFETGPAVGNLQLDDLFSGGGYSDYNLTLQADVSASANPAPGAILPGLDIAAELNELNILTGNSPTESEPGAQGNAHHIGIPSLLGDGGLHWLGL